MPKPPALRGKSLSALRAVAGAPNGLRIGAYPSVMPVLLQMGLVRLRDRGTPGWLLTDAGRQAVAEYGADHD